MQLELAKCIKALGLINQRHWVCYNLHIPTATKSMITVSAIILVGIYHGNHLHIEDLVKSYIQHIYSNILLVYDKIIQEYTLLLTAFIVSLIQEYPDLKSKMYILEPITS